MPGSARLKSGPIGPTFIKSPRIRNARVGRPGRSIRPFALSRGLRVKRYHRLELLVILGALTAFAPLAIDMYLPAMPAMALGLGADAAQAQFTLASFFLGFAVGQAAYGPLADRFGRKPPLYVGLILFAATSAGCALAPSVETLAALRFLQAIGACAGMVISRAMVRDLFEPSDTPRVYAALMLVMGAAPMLAPLLGGYLLILSGWRAIFWVLTGCGVASLLAVWLRLSESHDRAHIQSLALGRVLREFGALLAHREFVGYTLATSVGMAGMFAYIAASPFVFITLYGMTPEHFGWLFGINAFGIIASSQISARLVRRISADEILHAATAVQAVAGVALVAATATGAGGIVGIVVPLFVFVSCIGFVAPNATALAMAPHGRKAGTASSLLGTIQFVIAAIAATAVGVLNNGTALPMTAAIALFGVLGFVLYRALIGRPAREAVTP
jgi:MFS transporter, DHA1 family, multidrug resistance protein